MVVFAMIGLAIQYVMQMAFGFRAADDILGAVVNILIYTPCFSLIAMAIYNIETTHKVFLVGISLHHSLYIKEGALFYAGSVLHECSLQHIHDSARDDQAQEYAGDNGSYRYVALLKS